MSTLDFQDPEPELERSRPSNNQNFGANAAFYERLQGQGRKGALERYGWIALPVAAVAIIGVVAVTSTPHESANDVAGAAGQNTVAASTPAPAPAPAPKIAVASNNEAQATDQLPATPSEAQPAAKPPIAAKSSASAPAPMRLARKAPSSDTATSRPASAAPAQRTAPAPDTSVNPAPTPAVTQDAAPQPAAPAPSTDNSASQPAPAEAPAAQ